MATETKPDQTVDGALAVIGTGTMGSVMARRLLAAGRRVHVWNRTVEAARALAAAGAGAEAFTDPGGAVEGTRAVVTMLPTADVVTSVMVEGGVLQAMPPGAVWAQMGTIGVKGTQRLDAEVRSRRPDLLFVDAPVSGSRGPAEAGQLVVLASGPDEAQATMGPVFDVLGRRTLWLGPAGMGSRMKLILNTWLAFEVEAAAEAAALAEALGVPDDELDSAIDGSPLVSPYAAGKLAKMRSGDDSPDFALGLALKDLDLVEHDAGPQVVPVAAAIAERWRHLVADGAGGSDVSAARLGLAP